MMNPRFLGWYYALNGQRTGPVSTEEIDRLVGRGDVNPLEEVWSAWQHGKETTLLPTHRRRLHVLVVDDDRDTADTTALLLKLWGHEVQVTYDGEEAWLSACSSPPDIVLIDVVIPKLDGCRLARQIRQQDCCKRPLLVAMTGYSDEEHQRLCMEAGFDHCFLKPVDVFALHALLTLPGNGESVQKAQAYPDVEPGRFSGKIFT